MTTCTVVRIAIGKRHEYQVGDYCFSRKRDAAYVANLLNKLQEQQTNVFQQASNNRNENQNTNLDDLVARRLESQNNGSGETGIRFSDTESQQQCTNDSEPAKREPTNSQQQPVSSVASKYAERAARIREKAARGMEAARIEAAREAEARELEAAREAEARELEAARGMEAARIEADRQTRESNERLDNLVRLSINVGRVSAGGLPIETVCEQPEREALTSGVDPRRPSEAILDVEAVTLN